MLFDSLHTPDAEPEICVVSGMADGTTSAAMTQARSRVREIRSPGSARGAARKGRPYRDRRPFKHLAHQCSVIATVLKILGVVG